MSNNGVGMVGLISDSGAGQFGSIILGCGVGSAIKNQGIGKASKITNSGIGEISEL